MVVKGNFVPVEQEPVYDLDNQEPFDDQENEDDEQERYIQYVVSEVMNLLDSQYHDKIERVLRPIIILQDSVGAVRDWVVIVKNLIHLEEDQIRSIIDAYNQWRNQKLVEQNSDFSQMIESIQDSLQEEEKKWVRGVIANWQNIEVCIEENKRVDEIATMCAIFPEIPSETVRNIMVAYGDYMDQHLQNNQV